MENVEIKEIPITAVKGSKKKQTNLEKANLEILRERTRAYSHDEQSAVASALKSEVMEKELERRRIAKDNYLLEMQNIIKDATAYSI